MTTCPFLAGPASASHKTLRLEQLCTPFTKHTRHTTRAERTRGEDRTISVACVFANCAAPTMAQSSLPCYSSSVQTVKLCTPSAKQTLY
eukprot:1160899-Pelagomonas_calceolata.AAC.8